VDKVPVNEVLLELSKYMKSILEQRGNWAKSRIR